MHTLYLVSVYLHILAAVVWIGGMAFFVAVLVPLLKRPELQARAGALIHWVGLRFRAVGWASLGVLVVTGTFNLYARGVRPSDLSSGAFWRGGFGLALGIKLSLVAVILTISALHDFWIGPRATALMQQAPETARAVHLRKLARWIGRTNMILALAVVALAVILVRGWP